MLIPLSVLIYRLQEVPRKDILTRPVTSDSEKQGSTSMPFLIIVSYRRPIGDFILEYSSRPLMEGLQCLNQLSTTRRQVPAKQIRFLPASAMPVVTAA